MPPIAGPAIPADVAIGVACAHFGADRHELVSHRRRRELVRARAFAVWILRSLGEPLSYPQIGAQIERTHSGALRLHLKAIALRLTDPAFAAACQGVIDHFLSSQEVSHACH